MPIVDVPIWPLIIDSKPLGPLPVDPGLIRIAAARDVQPEDLVVGYFDGSLSHRWMWRAHPGEVCYRALPARHPLYADVLSLDGCTFAVQGHDEFLIVPAALAPVAYAVGDRVERPEPHPVYIGVGLDRPGTVTALHGDVLTVEWDHRPDPETVPQTAVRHTDAGA
ncbi:hypothetical protein ACFCWY_08630 [Streptomyces sp. NPDC056362]|uniref:hypothetical protein n=1 Tax=unclassified Streptomyces TaxID=2593676 RepID=UPI0035D847FD